MFIVKLLGRKGRTWILIDDYSFLVKSLLNIYDDLIVTVQPPSLNPANYSLKDFSGLNNVSPTLSVDSFISANINNLPTPLPNSNEIGITYSSIWENDLKASLDELNLANQDLSVITPRDISIMNAENNPNNLNDIYVNSLFFINGRVCESRFHNDKIYLMNEGLDIFKEKFRHISMVNFAPIGGYVKERIEYSNVEVINNDGVNILLHVTTAVNLSSKLFLLNLNGRLMIDGGFGIVDSNKFYIKLDLKRVLSYMGDINVNRLSWISPASIDNSGFNYQTFNVERFITNTLNEVIVLNNSNVYIRSKYMQKTGFRGRFTSDEIPRGILYLEDGTIADFSLVAASAFGYEIATTNPPAIKLLNDTESSNSSGNNADLSKASDLFMARLTQLYIFS